MQGGRFIEIAARRVEPGRPHLQIEGAGLATQREHEAELGAVDGAQCGIPALFGSHHYQRVILPHSIATHQQQLVAGIDRPVIGITHRAEQGGTADDAVAHQIDRTQKGLDGHLFAQYQQVLVTGRIDQWQYRAIGLLRMIQHRLQQGSGLVGRGTGVRFQILHIVAVDDPAARQQWQDEDQQGAAEA